MSLSAEAKKYVVKVIDNDELMAIDTCTSVMRGVMDFLGVGTATNVTDFNPAQDGLYSLVLNFGADINQPDHAYGWEHGIVLQNIGGDIVLYQGWVSSFTLGDWLLCKGTASTTPAIAYSPLEGRYSAGNMRTWQSMLKNLGGLVGDPRAFGATCEFLFGPKPNGTLTLQLADAVRRKAPLRFHWKYKALKPVDEV